MSAVGVDEDRLASIAQQLAGRVRDDDPEANLRWLRAELGTDPSRPVSAEERLLFVLAAHVPTDVKPSLLTAWWTGVPQPKPHGNSSAVGRHRYHKEALCELCRAFERERAAKYRAERVA